MNNIDLRLGDALENARILKDESVDFIHTDVPYQNTKHMDTLGMQYMEDIAWEFKRVMSKEANLLIYCGHFGQYDWHRILTNLGLHFIQELVWVYRNPASPARRYKNSFCFAHDPILFFTKSRKHYFNPNGCVEYTWMEHNSSSGFLRGMDHTPIEQPHEDKTITPKPLNMARDITKRLCPSGGLVFDPFMGYGTFAIPCIEQRKQFVGVEIDPRVYGVAENRMKMYRPQKKIQSVF